MNKINDQILGNYLNQLNMHPFEQQAVAACNRGEGVFFGKLFQNKAWVKFKEARDEINRRKTVVEALFPGFDSIQRSAEEREWTDDMNVFYFTLDWVRSELLKRVVRIEDGDEKARGELGILFSHAKNYFGNSLDCDQGYKFFFSREVVRIMTNFKEDFSEKSS